MWWFGDIPPFFDEIEAFKYVTLLRMSMPIDIIAYK